MLIIPAALGSLWGDWFLFDWFWAILVLIGIFEKLMRLFLWPFQFSRQIIIFLDHFEFFCMGSDFKFIEGLIFLLEFIFCVREFFLSVGSDCHKGFLEIGLQSYQEVSEVLWRIGILERERGLDVGKLFGEGSFKLGNHLRKFII